MIVYVVALSAEARPLIDHYRLKRVPDARHFPIYIAGDVILAVSGVGRLASAAATSYVYAWSAVPDHTVWINFGIAGHYDAPVGAGFVAHMVLDDATQKKVYPALVVAPPVATAAVRTVDLPCATPEPHWLYDMEAAGFMSAACRYSSVELVHCYKIVSDHGVTSSDQRPDFVADISALLAAHIDPLTVWADAIHRCTDPVRAAHAEPPGWALLRDRFKLTVSQHHRLRRDLQRLAVLSPQLERDVQALSASTSTRALMASVEQLLVRHSGYGQRFDSQRLDGGTT